ncbi:hypothetical protein GTP91_09875 [Rugamonas sp. FT82W]|uniref:Uncharacterized protein n=1 Tax=Duganella vulcania TaxID=2692166 RepID=A0A845G3A9_9BURK|nr:hypothetical protein [Duganella vulcania]MYM87487.1 hypothetical protein [Duganella vulcania]
MKKGIIAYGGETKWALDRQQNNRFVLCPVQMESKAQELKNFGEAAEEIRRQHPCLERDAAIDLILLSDFLYKLYVESKQSLI